ncbi:MAG: choice-of-anchor L domain-containing protein, partial [Pirellulaceae bacterium]
NVATVLEAESIKAIAPGPNGTVNSAQFLGNLAASPSNSDENLRLGFVIQGVISQTDDVDLYSFTAEAGTEVWLDVDRTSAELDVVIEVLNANGDLLARSDNSFDETIDPNQLVRGSLIDPNLVNIMPTRTQGQLRTNASGLIKDDYSFNMKDAGLRMVLPGAVGARSTYVFRVRSASLNADQSGAGLTKGTYQVQVRTREADEFSASTVQYADIRYATNGVHMRGLPLHSPLLGEFQEDESTRSTSATLANNDNPSVGSNPGTRPQYVGNLLQSDMGAISIGGRLSSSGDVDFYRFELTEGRLVSSGSNPIFHSVVFDMDYADGLNRADTSLALYRVTGFGTSETYELIHIGEDSNITDDRRRPQALQDLDDLSRGSVGAKDPFIGPVALASGTYLLAVTSAARTPAALTDTNVRRAPVPSVKRIAEDSLESLPLQTGAAPALPQLFDRSFTGGSDPRNLWHLSNAQAGVPGHRGSQSFAFASSTTKSISQPGGAAGDLISNAFNLGGYSASDLPVLYFNYQLSSDANDVFDVLVRRSNGSETLIASNSAPAAPTRLTGGGQWLQARVDLSSFAGQDGLKLVYRYNTVGDNADTTGVHIDDFVIGFAERGEVITNSPSDATFNTRSMPAGSVLTGEYQVEIRKAEDFFTSTLLSGLTLEKAWDTNDRNAQQTTLVAPEGRLLRDGDTFDLSDGSTKITFEFTTDNVVGLGNVQIRFQSTDSATVVARAIRDAINNPSVQSRLKVQATSTGGVASGNTGGDARIDLLGRASGDFRIFQPQSLQIRSQTTSAVTLRNEILGTGLTATNTVAPSYTGGTQSAALATFNGVDGILLSTGNVAGARGPNTSDRSSGVSSNSGDAMTNASLGVTTTDSTVLEFTFQFGNGNQGGNLYLDLIFASEEYNEFLGRDAVAVF